MEKTFKVTITTKKGYRMPTVEEIRNGVKTSDHCLGATIKSVEVVEHPMRIEPPKTYTIAVTKNGKTRKVVGTVAELAAHFRNIFVSANTIDPSVNPEPKTLAGLMTSLRKAKRADEDNFMTKGKTFALIG